MVDVQPVQHHIQHHGIVVFLDQCGDRRFQIERARAAQKIIHLPGAVLEGQLDVVQAGFFQRPQARIGQTDTGGDQIRIEAESMCLAHDRLQIVARQGLAAR